MRKYLAAHRRAALTAAVALSASVMPSIFGQAILDRPNLSATVRLNGQTYGSANAYFS